jgi:ergothioneine biosynthesis protein EgtB
MNAILFKMYDRVFFSHLTQIDKNMASMMSQIFYSKVYALVDLYRHVRERTMQIVAPLEIEDYVIQTAEFMSPPRWHIGHTSWFFETVLRTHQPGYKVYSDDYLFYFNSYYEGFGERIARPRRGTRSRPTVEETVAYRRHVDKQMIAYLESLDGRSGLDGNADAVLALVRLGLEHEMQHQELLVYDIKHLLNDQYKAPMKPAPAPAAKVEGMAEIAGGLFTIGYAGNDFAFDNEKPAHQIFLQDYALDRPLVTNGSFLEFMRDGGYQNFHWWYSEGWEVVNQEKWQAPLYWELHDGEWMIRDFSGLPAAADKANEPVSHVSFYEASAFAKWAGKRLPTEGEWEKAATFDSNTGARRDFPWGDEPIDSSKANLFENGIWAPAPISAFPEGQNSSGCQQMIGDVWEWTTSDYVPYPGFKSEFDEYNDKWFVNQKVLRGGSYATPQLHIRSTYRNFFHAHERWMVSGFRCAKDVT